jgi:hypothetical protein
LKNFQKGTNEERLNLTREDQIQRPSDGNNHQKKSQRRDNQKRDRDQEQNQTGTNTETASIMLRAHATPLAI